MAGEAESIGVWIDQDLCTGDGLCAEIAPDVFYGGDDGLYYVKEEAAHFGKTVKFDGSTEEGPAGGKGVARIPLGMLDVCIEAAEECPGECIFFDAHNRS